MVNIYIFETLAKTTFFFIFSFFQIYQKITIDKGRISPETSSLNKRSRLFFKDLYLYIYMFIEVSADGFYGIRFFRYLCVGLRVLLEVSALLLEPFSREGAGGLRGLSLVVQGLFWRVSSE